MRIRVPQLYTVGPASITATVSITDDEDTVLINLTRAGPTVVPPQPVNTDVGYPETWGRQPVYATALYPTGSQR